MCIMCVEIFKGRMTIAEGRKALPELLSTTEDEKLLAHYRELDQASDDEMQQLIAEENEDAKSN